MFPSSSTSIAPLCSAAIWWQTVLVRRALPSRGGRAERGWRGHSCACCGAARAYPQHWHILGLLALTGTNFRGPAMVIPGTGTRGRRTRSGQMSAVTSGQVLTYLGVCSATPTKKGAAVQWRSVTAQPILWPELGLGSDLFGSGRPRTTPMSARNEACSCSSAGARVWVTTSLTSLPRQTGFSSIQSSSRPSRIAMSVGSA